MTDNSILNCISGRLLREYWNCPDTRVNAVSEANKQVLWMISIQGLHSPYFPGSLNPDNPNYASHEDIQHRMALYHAD